MDLFAKMKSALTENNFAFYNPVCFLEKLDGAGLLEFNPYEGKHIQALHNASNVNLDLAHHNSGFDAVSCPGFAPAVTSASGVNAQKYPFEYNGLHLSEYKKQKGAPVFPNEIVALAGNTGGSKGDHLHLEVFECDNNSLLENVINSEADESFEMKWKNGFKHTTKRVNPFNHKEH